MAWVVQLTQAFFQADGGSSERQDSAKLLPVEKESR